MNTMKRVCSTTPIAAIALVTVFGIASPAASATATTSNLTGSNAANPTSSVTTTREVHRAGERFAVKTPKGALSVNTYSFADYGDGPGGAVSIDIEVTDGTFTVTPTTLQVNDQGKQPVAADFAVLREQGTGRRIKDLDAPMTVHAGETVSLRYTFDKAGKKIADFDKPMTVLKDTEGATLSTWTLY
ncbi:hypothetical protein QP948_10430 [Corynebacterium bovis]|uniref:hypothetical protein n=1 Tax=Corynebacterium bovis TaxID=36808 RepID=UPI002549DD98|nr:hypothetical protein [Corynebacterium bovis]MDK8511801.1 hypothetical protein [Corynebacterium bovis]